MIYTILGSLIFGGIAWLWRNKWSDKRVHLLLALLFTGVAWFGSWMLGLWVLLDVLQAGPLGHSLGQGIWLSIFPAGLSYWILRQKDRQEKPKNLESYDTGPETQS